MCMNDKKKYKISLLGEFIDKSIESEYLIDSLRSSSKITSYTALVIGFIMMLFLVNGYIVDDFKEINDKYGHLAGDSVAIKIVETISKTIRDTDIFARWGGDEFVLLLPNTDVQEAENMAERMRDCISNNLCDPIRNITCSFGVAAYEKNDTIQSLLNKADKLLLQAKASGKDRVVSMDSCTAQN
jgi:diguanylate cyclase (GGDEF)-like protein